MDLKTFAISIITASFLCANLTEAGWYDSLQTANIYPQKQQEQKYQSQFPPAYFQAPISSQDVNIFNQPNGILIGVLKEIFTDVDWQLIAAARYEIEKFIQKVEKIVTMFRNRDTQKGASRDGRMGPTGRWWTMPSKTPAQPSADETVVKATLERMACSMGYMRLMNLGAEALAELEASKVVTSIFSKSNSSNSTRKAI